MTDESLPSPLPNPEPPLLESAIPTAPSNQVTGNDSAKPLVVVVFTHNDEATLERCLNSIHSGVHDIWVLDAGSTDSTVTIARRYTEHVYYVQSGDPWRLWQDAVTGLQAEYPQDAWVLWLEPGDWLPEDSLQQLERWHRLESPVMTGGLLLKQVLHHWNHQPLYWGGLLHHDCRLALLSAIRPDDSPLFCGWAMASVSPLPKVVINHQPYPSFSDLLQGAFCWRQQFNVHRLFVGKAIAKPVGVTNFVFKLLWIWVRYLGCLDGSAGFFWLMACGF